MKTIAFISAAFLFFPWLGRADDSGPAKFYRLDFVVQEVEGTKVVNSREYSITDAIDIPPTRSSIRTSSQVPIRVAPSLQTQQFSIGVDIDVDRTKEVGGGLALNVDASITNLSSQGQPDAIPIIRKQHWSATVLIPLKKATVIFSSDDFSSTHKMQLVLTATPMK